MARISIWTSPSGVQLNRKISRDRNAGATEVEFGSFHAMSVLTSSRILDWTRLRYISVYILIQRVENLSPPLLSSKRIFPTNIWKFVKEARWMTKKSRVNELSVRKKKFFHYDFIKSPRSFARFAQRLVIYYSFASSIPHRRLNFLNRYRASPRPTPLSTPSPPLLLPAFPMIYTYIYIEGGRVWNDVTEGWKGEGGGRRE